MIIHYFADSLVSSQYFRLMSVMVCIEFPILTGLVGELRLKYFHFIAAVPSSGRHIGWHDDETDIPFYAEDIKGLSESACACNLNSRAASGVPVSITYR